MTAAGKYQNKPLINMANGKKLGEVKDLYLDSGLTQVMAVLTATEGFLSRQSLAIARSYIQVYGVDAWLVAGESTVVRIEDIAGSDTFVLVSSLRGREIQTEGKTKIGTVGDVLLDAEAQVLGLALQKVYIRGPLAERKAIARSAITDVGSKDAPILAVLEQAEAGLIEQN